MRVCVCVAKPEAVELRCHATALILAIGKAQFRRAMLSCDSPCCICENKDADQLCGNREADQRLCFPYKDSAIPLLPKSKISSL